MAKLIDAGQQVRLKDLLFVGVDDCDFVRMLIGKAPKIVKGHRRIPRLGAQAQELGRVLLKDQRLHFFAEAGYGKV